MEVFDVYKDIQARTNGEIYLGVVGPVRTGKSTFTVTSSMSEISAASFGTNFGSVVMIVFPDAD